MEKMELMPGTQLDVDFNSTTNEAGNVPAAAARSKSKAAAARAAGERLAAEMRVFESVALEVGNKLDPSADFANRCQQVLTWSAEIFGVAPTWTAFYREVLGKDGMVHKLFPNHEERANYEECPQHCQILEMLTTLRSRDLPENDPTEPQRMITIRLPLTLHDAICNEANELEVSVNKLCITRMLQQLDKSMLPICKNKRRGRRPGSNHGTSTPNTATPVSQQ